MCNRLTLWQSSSTDESDCLVVKVYEGGCGKMKLLACEEVGTCEMMHSRLTRKSSGSL